MFDAVSYVRCFTFLANQNDTFYNKFKQHHLQQIRWRLFLQKIKSMFDAVSQLPNLQHVTLLGLSWTPIPCSKTPFNVSPDLCWPWISGRDWRHFCSFASSFPFSFHLHPALQWDDAAFSEAENRERIEREKSSDRNRSILYKFTKTDTLSTLRSAVSVWEKESMEKGCN